MNYRNTPMIATGWAVFRKADPQETEAGHLWFFGFGQQLGVVFRVIARLQAPKPNSVGVVTLDTPDGQEVLLGDEVLGPDRDDEFDAAFFGEEAKDLFTKDGKDNFVFVQVEAPGSYFNGAAKVRPKYTKPAREPFMADHANYNITHFRRLEKVAPKTTPGSAVDLHSIDWDSIPETPSSRGGATVAFYVDISGPSTETMVAAKFFFGVSICSESENFNRLDGSTRAVRRAIEARGEEFQAKMPELGVTDANFSFESDISPIADKPFSYHQVFPLRKGVDFTVSERGVKLANEVRQALAFVFLAGVIAQAMGEVAEIRKQLVTSDGNDEEYMRNLLRQYETKAFFVERLQGLLRWYAGDVEKMVNELANELASDDKKLMEARRAERQAAVADSTTVEAVMVEPMVSAVDGNIDGFATLTAPVASTEPVAEEVAIVVQQELSRGAGAEETASF